MAISLSVGEHDSNWRISLTENDFPNIINEVNETKTDIIDEANVNNDNNNDETKDELKDNMDSSIIDNYDISMNPEDELSVDENGSTFLDDDNDKVNFDIENENSNIYDDNPIDDNDIGNKEKSLNQLEDFSLVTNSMFNDESTYEGNYTNNNDNNGSILNDLPSIDFAEYLQDDCFLDAKDVVENIGKQNRRHVHDLFLRSAYESSSCGAEPIFTTSKPSEGKVSGVRCEDYIFYSANAIKVNLILSIPPIIHLNGEDPRQNIMEADPYMNLPYQSSLDHFSDNPMNIKLDGRRPNAGAITDMKRRLQQKLDESLVNKNKFYGGTWIPYYRTNCLRNHYWLPNDKFCSDHLAICAEFEFLDSFLSVEWK